jgi:N-carbamoylputrescine amidase
MNDRTLRVAAIQMESANGDVAGNLARAGRWSEAAARRGAELILLPELFSTGFELNDRSWQSAEPQGGPSERWLLDTARRHGCHIGGSYLEARGEDFFNTFALAAPDGSIAGRVRKSHPCSIEAYVFKARRRPARDRHGALPHRRRHLLRREPTGGMGQDPGRRS